MIKEFIKGFFIGFLFVTIFSTLYFFVLILKDGVSIHELTYELHLLSITAGALGIMTGAANLLSYKRHGIK